MLENVKRQRDIIDTRFFADSKPEVSLLDLE